LEYIFYFPPYYRQKGGGKQVNQQDEDKAIKRKYRFPSSRNMEMSWEFNPPMARPENSTLFSGFRHHNSHGPEVDLNTLEERHRQRK